LTSSSNQNRLADAAGAFEGAGFGGGGADHPLASDPFRELVLLVDGVLE